MLVHSRRTNGATLGLGLKERAQRSAQGSGRSMARSRSLLNWHPVKPGDFFYVPAVRFMP